MVKTRKRSGALESENGVTVDYIQGFGETQRLALACIPAGVTRRRFPTARWALTDG